MVRVYLLRFQPSVLYSVENSPFRAITVARVGTPCISTTAASAAVGSVWVTLAAKPGRWKTTRVTYSSSVQPASLSWSTPSLWVQLSLWLSQAALGTEMTQLPASSRFT